MVSAETERRTPDVPVRRRVVRGLGWLLVAAGAIVLLYVVYALFYTGQATAEAQRDMLERWEQDLGAPPDALVDDTGGKRSGEETALNGSQDASFAMWFERPGTDRRPVTEDTLLVVDGVDLESLKRGPGHQPDTASPGGDGNVVVAGHRTTYGAPFYDLDQLEPGDEIHLVDRGGDRHRYVVERDQIVDPDATWVTGEDPLDIDRPTLTLFTCYPRFSAAQRLVVFAELAG